LSPTFTAGVPTTSKLRAWIYALNSEIFKKLLLALLFYTLHIKDLNFSSLINSRSEASQKFINKWKINCNYNPKSSELLIVYMPSEIVICCDNSPKGMTEGQPKRKRISAWYWRSLGLVNWLNSSEVKDSNQG
jgi:hypothetical protein